LQHQDWQPGCDYKMKPRPKSEGERHPGSGLDATHSIVISRRRC
jgi:hypothetical protein